MLAVRPGVGCIPAGPGTMPDVFIKLRGGIGLEVPVVRPDKWIKSWRAAPSAAHCQLTRFFDRHSLDSGHSCRRSET